MPLAYEPPAASQSVRPNSGRVADRPTVAVVGAGFSGLMAALHLLEHPDGPRVRLIERRPIFACGAAYSTRFKDHLLNVRASNMSAYPDRPDHFVKWLAADGGETTPAAFVSRSRYGRYLQALLDTAAKLSEPGRLLLEADDVVALHPKARGWRLTFAMGRAIDVDAVVLATGNFPPHLPPGITGEAAASPAFLADPWSGSIETAPEAGTAILVGTGLTMVDVVQRLHAERPDLRVLAISRRGLLPRRHLDAGPAPLAWDPGTRPTIRKLILHMRALSRSADWRAVIDGLRPHVQSIWRSWTADERSRFLRHARPWWDVHRHRLAPDVAERVDRLQADGVLNVAAGRIQRIESDGNKLQVTWRPRGEAGDITTSADLVVNCSGPSGQLARSSDPLIADLARQDLIRSDAQGLGLDVDPLGRPVGASGEVAETLFCIGPVTRGAFWEITSVPDIRVQAVACAQQVVDSLDSLSLVA